MKAFREDAGPGKQCVCCGHPSSTFTYYLNDWIIATLVQQSASGHFLGVDLIWKFP